MITNAAWSPFRPPRPACWLNSQVSLGRPGRFLFNTLDPDTSYPYRCWRWERCQGCSCDIVASHTCTLGADEQSAGPWGKRWEFCKCNLHGFYPVAKAAKTRSFSSCVFSPLSFSIEDASKQGSPRDPAFSFAQDAGEGECNRQKWCTSFEVFLTDWLLQISSSIIVSEWENIKSLLISAFHGPLAE